MAEHDERSVGLGIIRRIVARLPLEAVIQAGAIVAVELDDRAGRRERDHERPWGVPTPGDHPGEPTSSPRP